MYKFRLLPTTVFLLMSFISTLVFAQQLSVDSLQKAITSATQTLAESGLAKEQQDSIEQRLNKAQASLNEATEFNQTLQQYEQEVVNANAKLAALKKQKLQLSYHPVDNIDKKSREQLSNQLIVLEARQNELATQLQALQKQLTTISNRPASISNELNAAKELQYSVNASLEKLNQQNSDISAQSTLLALQAKAVSLEAQIHFLEGELATLPARQSVLESQTELLQAQLEIERDKIATIQSHLEQSLTGDADKALETSQQALEKTQGSNELVALARENVTLANILQKLTFVTPDVDDNIAKLRLQIQDLRQSSETVERVLATGQMTDELGVLLHRLRSGLPKEAPLSRRLEQIDEMSVRQQLNLILWQDKIRNLSSYSNAPSQSYAEQTFDSFPADEQQAAKQLTATRLSLLQQLVDVANRLVDKLTEEKLLITQALDTSAEVRTTLDGRLVWLPSYTDLTDNIVPNLIYSIEWLLSPTGWLQVGKDVWIGITKSPVFTALAFLLPILILFFRQRIKRSLQLQISRIGKVGRDTYWATPLALLETFVLALPLPIFIGTLAALISIGSESGSFSTAVATALAAVSSLSLTLLFFRSMCRKNGIFVGHFGWSDTAREKLRKILSWFVWLQGLATFTFAMSIGSNQLELRYGIAIIAFMTMSIGIALFSFYFFRPKTGVAANIVGDTPPTLLTVLAYPVMVAAPLLIGLLPLTGFFDTAVELLAKLFQSEIVLIFIAIFYGILMRIFMVAYRRYCLRKKIKLRAEQGQLRTLQAEAEASGEALPIPKPDELPDNDTVLKQMRSTTMGLCSVLFLGTLWFIWKPLLPALGIVNEIVLWHKTTVVDGIEIFTEVTLWNIILSLIFLFGGFIAARNAKGILEVSFFDRVTLDAGARYAAVTILGYVLVGMGIVIGLGQLGIDWSKLQWIVAALGVGLGFGLQEIVANFVSGLIILFERPIRVGDTVTIGSLSGTVSNIKIRATTITDFENREVLLPNKSIITENVTNWTLNDAVTRILIRIGVAYGSDTRRAREILMQVLESHPDVLKTPSPSVFFMNHGESSLDFELRIFVDTPAKRLPVTHEINVMINEALDENGFEIPFPQRDLHIISGGENLAAKPI